MGCSVCGEGAADIAGARGLPEEARTYREAAAAMEATVWDHGWDGAWFRRAYDAFGQVIGSASCDEGQIFIEPQGICTMAGLGIEGGRAVMALDSVRGAPGYGARDPAPATRLPLDIRFGLGEISSYPPGSKENASNFYIPTPDHDRGDPGRTR